MRNLWFAVCLSLAAPTWATVEENEVAARLSRDATQFLDQLLGPGHAKVLVNVEGESSEVQTETEVTTPIPKQDAKGRILPGYMSIGERNVVIDSFQKDMERSSRRGEFQIKKMHVSVVLDSALPDSQVKAIQKMLPELLRMNTERGDDLAILRASFFTPPWRAALVSPEGIRILVVVGTFVCLALLICVLAYFTAMRVVRAFVQELSQRRTAGAPGQAGVFGPITMAQRPGEMPGPSGGGGLLPTGLGGVPTLEGGMDAMERGSDLPALGRRFDFLTGREPTEVADILSKESPDDLSLLFAYLAESNPNLATRIFSSLPSELQGQISQALVKLSMADPERLAMLESRVKTSVEFGLRGPDRLGRILSRLPPGEREGLMGDLMSKDPTGAEGVEKSLLPFERIIQFKPEELRRLIVTVPYEDWGTALRGASQELSDRILAELPAGTRNLVQEASQVPQHKDKVMECRSRILSQVQALAGRGLIDLSSQGVASEMI